MQLPFSQDCEPPYEINRGFTFTNSLDEFLKGPSPDADADAAAMIELAGEEEEQTDDEKLVPVDSSFGMESFR